MSRRTRKAGKDRAKKGTYSASLLGTIASHLEGLQGYDVMALELLQNADDAKAKEMVFDVTAEGLGAWNDKSFTNCGELESKPCPWKTGGGPGGPERPCDFHNLAEVGSRGKRNDPENIGRFGIGFVSVYQVTDQPVVASDGTRITLRPVQGTFDIEEIEGQDGTEIWLPWATDQGSQTRRELGLSPIKPGDIDGISNDIQEVLASGTLFLKNVRSAELKRDGKRVFRCNTKRSGKNHLRVTMEPGKKAEEWLILETDAVEQAKGLFEEFPRLKELDRKTSVVVAFRLEPGSLEKGLLYAYLPTQQSPGLPFHLNADFFPEPDRKRIVLAGKKHQQAWNEMLVKAAAAEVASNLEALSRELGPVETWKLIDAALRLSSNEPDLAECFRVFWSELHVAAQECKVTWSSEEKWHGTNDVYLSSKALGEDEIGVLRELGISVVHEDLREYHEALAAVGVKELGLELVLNALEEAFPPAEEAPTPGKATDKARLKKFYEPLWRLISSLLLTGNDAQVIDRLKAIPAFVSTGLQVTPINTLYVLTDPVQEKDVAQFLPGLPVAHSFLRKHHSLTGLMNTLDFLELATVLAEKITGAGDAEALLGNDARDLRKFYSFLASYPPGENPERAWEILRDIPLAREKKGFIKPSEAVLPGDFEDPIGVPKILDNTLLTAVARDFFEKKLGVPSLSLEVFIVEQLPRFFDGDVDHGSYGILVNVLLGHQQVVLESDECREALSNLPMVPTRDGGWGKPTEIYFRTDELAGLVGDSKQIWVDEKRLPGSKLVKLFLEQLGISETARLEHMLGYLDVIVSGPPKEKARGACEGVFYELCDRFDKAASKAKTGHPEYSELRGKEFLPAHDDENWHQPSELYAPIREQAFNSQVQVLPFRNMQKLSNPFLEYLGVKMEPETRQVVDHLVNCIGTREPPHYFTYQILSERLKDDANALADLKDMDCIYDGSRGKFLRPGQLYWQPPYLGHYGFKVPENLYNFRPLLEALGVKDQPGPVEHVLVLQEIAEAYEDTGEEITPGDEEVYLACVQQVVKAIDDKHEQVIDLLEDLQNYPCVLTRTSYLASPTSVAKKNSEWLASRFQEEVDSVLVDPRPDHAPFYDFFGLKDLTEVVAEEIEELGHGEPWEEGRLMFKERSSVLQRLLHDQPTSCQEGFRKALKTMTVMMHEKITVTFKLEVGTSQLSSEPQEVQALFLKENNQLLVSGVSEETWFEVFRAIFHRLLPAVGGSNLQSIVSTAVTVMEVNTVEEAGKWLDRAWFPPLREETGKPVQPGTEELGGIGEEDSQEATGDEAGETGESKGPQDGTPGDQSGKGDMEGEEDLDESGDSADTDEAGEEEERKRKKREKAHRKKLDRFISYVAPMEGKKTGAGKKLGEASVLDLEVANAAVTAACQREISEGRVPTRGAHNQPGYDVRSVDDETGEERFIEVKGLHGEWGAAGVGLTKTQFLKAQSDTTSFWLYVVEYALDPGKAVVYPIRDPATKVERYFFDKNWRQASEKPSKVFNDLFFVGQRIEAKGFGWGEIFEVDESGHVKKIKVKFDNGQEKQIDVNRETMKPIFDKDN